MDLRHVTASIWLRYSALTFLLLWSAPERFIYSVLFYLFFLAFPHFFPAPFLSHRAPTQHLVVMLTLYLVYNYVGQQVFRRALKPAIQPGSRFKHDDAKTILIIFSKAGM